MLGQGLLEVHAACGRWFLWTEPPLFPQERLELRDRETHTHREREREREKGREGGRERAPYILIVDLSSIRPLLLDPFFFSFSRREGD